MDQTMTTTTSLLMASKDHQNTAPQNHHDRNPPVRRASGRKKSNKGASDNPQQSKKKIPQRGMGIAKLERQRLEGIRQKEMSETNLQGFGVPVAALFSADQSPANLMVNGASHVPLQFSRLGVGGLVELNHNLQNVQQLPLGFHGQVSVAGGFLLLDHQQFQAGDPRLPTSGCFRNNTSLDYVGNKNVSGICGEFPSTPNVVKCFAQHCNICHKKKKVYGENSGTGKLLPSDKSNNVGDQWGFLGLNAGDDKNIIHQMENHAIVAKGSFAPHVGLSVGHVKQDLEIVAAVHPSSSGGVLMEYDFFLPGEGGSSRPNNSHNDETVNAMMKQLVGIGGGSTEVTTCSSSSMDDTSGGMLDASTTIDLSLKLSY